MFECKAWLSDLSPYSNTEHLKFMEKKTTTTTKPEEYYWSYPQWRPRQDSDILSRNHVGVQSLLIQVLSWMTESPKPLFPSLLQESVPPSITGDEIVLYIGDAVIHRLISEICPWDNFSKNNYSISLTLCLWSISLAYLRGKLQKREKIHYIKPWGCFHPRDLQSICSGRMSMISQ